MQVTHRRKHQLMLEMGLLHDFVTFCQKADKLLTPIHVGTPHVPVDGTDNQKATIRCAALVETWSQVYFVFIDNDLTETCLKDWRDLAPDKREKFLDHFRQVMEDHGLTSDCGWLSIEHL